AALGARGVHAGLHSEPAGERHSLRVRRAARHPHDRRPAAHHTGGTTMSTVGLVTGAGRGIGAACAHRLAPTVDTLLLADLDEANLTETACALQDDGRRCDIFVSDLAAPDAAPRIAARIAELGRLRSVAHVAGI